MQRIFYKEKNDFYFETFEKRKCKNDEIEIETRYLGLCSSDIQKFLKQTPNKNYINTNILGHEIMGVISNFGDNCEGFNIGDKVVVNPFDVAIDHAPCESFSLCNDIKIVGRDIDGGYSEVVYVPKNCVYKLSDNIDDEDAIFIDDIAVALHGINYIKEIKINNIENIAVIGDGPLGIICYRILKSMYSDKNIILFAKHRDKIKNLEINYLMFEDMQKCDIKFDVILETVGGAQSDTLNTSIEVGNNNCLILCYGVYAFNYLANINVRTLFYKQGTLKGINSYCNIHNDFKKSLDLLEKKDIQVNDLISYRIDFLSSVEYINNYKNIKDNIKTVFEVKK